MEITTKANPGDTVWYLYNSSVCSSAVQNIDISIFRNKTALNEEYVDIIIQYKTCHLDDLLDEDLFLSKKELAQAILEGEL